MNLELARPAPHVIPNPQRGEEFSVYNRERFLKIRGNSDNSCQIFSQLSEIPKAIGK